jgi:hypothetical protein
MRPRGDVSGTRIGTVDSPGIIAVLGLDDRAGHLGIGAVAAEHEGNRDERATDDGSKKMLGGRREKLGLSSKFRRRRYRF